MYLWVDIKSSPTDTLPAVVDALQPLKRAGYLTSYDKGNGGVKNGPITIIGTGNTQLSQVQGVSPRDYFYDAPLAKLKSTYSNITSDVSPIASVDLKSAFGDNTKDMQKLKRTGRFSKAQQAILDEQVSYAHSKGIGARYWDTPGFPISTRNRIWTTLWEAGVALINVDDLVAGASFSEGGD